MRGCDSIRMFAEGVREGESFLYTKLPFRREKHWIGDAKKFMKVEISTYSCQSATTAPLVMQPPSAEALSLSRGSKLSRTLTRSLALHVCRDWPSESRSV